MHSTQTGTCRCSAEHTNPGRHRIVSPNDAPKRSGQHHSFQSDVDNAGAL